jgi:hypothetical protein
MNNCIAERATEEVLGFFVQLFVPELNELSSICTRVWIIIALIFVFVNRLVISFIFLFEYLERRFILASACLAITLAEHQISQIEGTCIVASNLIFCGALFN